ncbi:MAG: cytochrome b N-terminal domain-containing protein [Treponema sp.]|nr:cytochrome b N-terminal domain-containing protein [Treponema sp.]
MKRDGRELAEKKLGPQFASLMIDEAPHYANRFFYSLGFLAATSFAMLVVTGVVEVFFGASWWLTKPAGVFFRSLHLWSTQAFVIFILLHLVVVFCTMGYRGPRRITWVFGVFMFFFALIETELGYALRGDFSTQWRALQGADFFNGSGLGWWINPLNELKIFGIHAAIVPLIIILLLSLHYMLVRFLGIATPPVPDAEYQVEKANHTALFLRGGVVLAIIILLAIALPSPYLKPVSIAEVAKSDPNLVAQTLVGEFGRLEQIGKDPDGRGLTTGYSDNIQPYNYDTRLVYVDEPWKQLVAAGQQTDDLAAIEGLSADDQKKLVDGAIDFFGDNKGGVKESDNKLIGVAKRLTAVAASGWYDSALKGMGQPGDSTYQLRFLADLGVLEDKADKLHMLTEQWGMLREEEGGRPGAWWLAPIGLLNKTILASDDNGDRDGAYLLGILVLILAAIPFIPGVNRIPVALRLYTIFQRKRRKG